jgi:hypothetical protein
MRERAAVAAALFFVREKEGNERDAREEHVTGERIRPRADPSFPAACTLKRKEKREKLEKNEEKHPN